MKRVVGGALLAVGLALGILGVVTGLQLRAPGWQKVVTVLLFLAVAFALGRVGRRLWRQA